MHKITRALTALAATVTAFTALTVLNPTAAAAQSPTAAAAGPVSVPPAGNGPVGTVWKEKHCRNHVNRLTAKTVRYCVTTRFKALHDSKRGVVVTDQWITGTCKTMVTDPDQTAYRDINVKAYNGNLEATTGWIKTAKCRWHKALTLVVRESNRAHIYVRIGTVAVKSGFDIHPKPFEYDVCRKTPKDRNGC